MAGYVIESQVICYVSLLRWQVATGAILFYGKETYSYIFLDLIEEKDHSLKRMIEPSGYVPN